MSVMTPLLQQPLSHPNPNPSTPVLPNASEDFHHLIAYIRSKLGPNDGIAASQSITTELEHLMEQYPANELSWKHFAFRDHALAFTRNLVDRRNGNFNLVRIVRCEGFLHGRSWLTEWSAAGVCLESRKGESGA